MEYGVQPDATSLKNAAQTNSVALVRQMAVRVLRTESQPCSELYRLLSTNDPAPLVRIEACYAIGTNDLAFSIGRMKIELEEAQALPWVSVRAIEYLGALGDYSGWNTLDRYLSCGDSQMLLRQQAIAIAPMFAAANRQAVVGRLKTLLDTAYASASDSRGDPRRARKGALEIRVICKALTAIGDASVVPGLKAIEETASGDVKRVIQDAIESLMRSHGVAPLNTK